ncbi:hypothetical protein BDW02DRAFT_118754 [Decorospora gaudefroyi]|uniref:Uncharacterized protein n=1 Tax=Decorospora gaudefroyi TaxID=184978 RepID=A0A6A5KNQ9_9PLEO|nr:hypothetical protein BDW02DRAFT_118754 [Decorospora gaudefroyi]
MRRKNRVANKDDTCHAQMRRSATRWTETSQRTVPAGPPLDLYRWMDPKKNENQVAESYGFTQEKPGRCFVVSNPRYQESFLDSGDSGSILIHDPLGTQLGLLFGETGAKQGLMIPMGVIFGDIKKVTGKQVVWPEYCDPAEIGLA